MLSHMVYFTLKDSSDSACQTLVDACQKYLKPHDGIQFFAAGTLAPEFDRPVNDRAFHVALHVVFDTKASHDAYQVSENHLAFIAEGLPNWETVRVFDAYVEG
ncbi:MAG: Dabb family protein [Planctomycetaceae bacterium]